MQLKDVAVLITGGGSGLGAATARAMAAKGAKVGVLDQSEENAEKVAAQVKGIALHGDVTDAKLYEALKKQIGSKHHCLFYLEMPPSLFAPIVEHLAEADLLTGSRVAVEKPFGHDLKSALELNERLRAVLDEDQIFRVDHFLGKEPVVELEYLRFGNLALSELWDRSSIAEIQITMAEDFGVEDRGHFYDPVGALRDVVVNHLMQVVAASAMEAPAGGDPETLQGAKLNLYRAIATADPADYVRGQYDGYRKIDGVAPDSTTETYAALRLDIENWRFAGVPFFIRTGKLLPHTLTEMRLVFKHPPKLGFHMTDGRHPEPDQLVIKLDPSTGVRFTLDAHRADAPEPEAITLDMEFAQEGGEGPTPYEVLLNAAMQGESSRFTRQDGVEQTWRIMGRLLDSPPPVHPYAPGSWGPAAADELVAGHGAWHHPWVTA